MAKTRVLYGKKIVPHHMLNYAEQVYDILVGEIELGRWKVNDRLPGVMALAKELGFGTKTVQTAYDRLKEDGYVRTLGYRGTYLKSMHPMAAQAGGTLGVLVSEAQTGDPLVLWYEHVILQWARKRNLVTDVRVLPPNLPARDIPRVDAVFGGGVAGILSLTPFRMPLPAEDAFGNLPLVFLCPPYEPCSPKVCADVREAYYELTARLIRCGHTRIVFSEDSLEPDPRQTALHREGYLAAMRDHGASVDETAMEASRAVRNPDLADVAAHLRSLMRRKRGTRPTAIVAGSLGRSMVLNRVAPLCKVAIPEDLSIVSIGCADLDGREGFRLTGMLPDFDQMIGECFRILEQQRVEGRTHLTEVAMRMHLVPGNTMRALNGCAVASEGPAPHHSAREIENLSRLAHA